MECSLNCKRRNRIRGPNVWKETRCPLHSINDAPNQTNFNLKYYNRLFKGHTNLWAHGGVAIFIHETIPYQKIILNTPQQAIAARINIGRDFTIVSIFNSRSQDIRENISSTLFQELLKPVILTRDFNSFHQIFGNQFNNNKGFRS